MSIRKVKKQGTFRDGDQHSPEETQMVKSAAKNIRRVSGRLSEDIIFDILMWTAEGNEATKIARRLYQKHGRPVALTTIQKYQKEYAPRIRELSLEWDKAAITAGLSRKTVRVRKLMRLADAIEEALLPEDGEALELGRGGAKLIDTYRQLLNQIAGEVGDREQALGDIAFTSMTDEELMRHVTEIVTKNKDLAVLLAEKSGTRPVSPIGPENDGNKPRTRLTIVDGTGEEEEGEPSQLRGTG